MAGGEGSTLIHLAVCLVTCVVEGVNTIPAVDEGGVLGDRLIEEKGIINNMSDSLNNGYSRKDQTVDYCIMRTVSAQSTHLSSSSTSMLLREEFLWTAISEWAWLKF